MGNINVVPFSSFLAGVLLVKREISFLELSKLWADFQSKMNVEFTKESEDYNLAKLKHFYSESSGLSLNGRYDDVVNIGNKKYTVYECLYGFTDQIVRDYFNFPSKYSPDFKWEMDLSTKKSRS